MQCVSSMDEEGLSGVFVVNITSITVSFTPISFLLISLKYPLYSQTADTLELISISILSFSIQSTMFSIISLTFSDSPAILIDQAYPAFPISRSTFTSISLTHRRLIFISASVFYSTSFPLLTFTGCCFHKISTADEYPSVLAIDRHLYSPTHPLSSP